MAQILTEQMFVDLGGKTGTASAYMIQTAFNVAEDQTEQYLGSPLNPTVITGTYRIYPYQDTLFLKHQGVITLDAVNYVSASGTAEIILQAPDGAYLLNGEAGLLDIRNLCGLGTPPSRQLQVVYTAGFPTGMLALDSRVQMALVSAAQLVLNELQNPGAFEARVGIQHFTSMRYSETRFKLRDTPFGSSAQAQYIAKMLEKRKFRRVGKVGG